MKSYQLLIQLETGRLGWFGTNKAKGPLTPFPYLLPLPNMKVSPSIQIPLDEKY